MKINVKYQRQRKLLEDLSLYRKLIGSLIYFTITGPNIFYVVQHCQQVYASPPISQLVDVRRIIQYILGTPSCGLFFCCWLGWLYTRKSTTGWCLFLGDALIFWKCKKQDCISKFSIEAEYRAMSVAWFEIIWLRGLLKELGFFQVHPTPLHDDNTSVIQIVVNPIYHERMKHI